MTDRSTSRKYRLRADISRLAVYEYTGLVRERLDRQAEPSRSLPPGLLAQARHLRVRQPLPEIHRRLGFPLRAPPKGGGRQAAGDICFTLKASIVRPAAVSLHSR